MTDKEAYELAPKRRELSIALGRLRSASDPVVGTEAARRFELEMDVERLLREVRHFEARNRTI